MLKSLNHHERAKLPAHRAVEEINIHLEGALSHMVCIGKEITEELECESAKFYITRSIRYKDAAKNEDGDSIAYLPKRVIDRNPRSNAVGIDPDRDIQIPSSTIKDWIIEVLIKL